MKFDLNALCVIWRNSCIESSPTIQSINWCFTMLQWFEELGMVMVQCATFHETYMKSPHSSDPTLFVDPITLPTNP